MAGAGIPSFYHLLGAGSGEYLPGPDYNAMAMSEAGGTSREAPAVYQTAEFSVPRVNYVGFPLGSDAFRTPDLSSAQHIEPVGASHEEDEAGNPGLELNFGTHEATPGRQEHKQHSGETSRMDNVQQRDILIFPEDEDDAVTITDSDLEGLQPGGFLSNNIIDFYIKFLERGLSSEDRARVYFFKSFFFAKLWPDSRSSAEIHELCRVDFDGVRRWTMEVNLFEKDYVFIPILRSSHWSLIIVCHLSGLTNSRDLGMGSPCVYHLDPIGGQHESFEDQIRSYMIQACMERYEDSDDGDRMIIALAYEMKYVRVEVPQQGNGHDCGVYLLHYVEVFLRASTSANFNFASASNIWGPDFAEEASSKRWDIQSRISELSKNPQGQLSRPMDMHPKPHPRASDAPNPYGGRKSSPKPRNVSQSKLSKEWKEDETSLLLNRMVGGDLIRKETKPATDWDAISQGIKTELGCIRTADECRRRYDTLLKAYKKVEKTGKSFWDTTKEERAELNLATPLTEEWCRAIDTISRQRKSGTAKTRKRAKRSPDGEDDMRSGNPAPSPAPSGSPAGGKPSKKQVAIPGFTTLREELRFTLLHLVQYVVKPISAFAANYELEEVCRMLAIVEDRKPLEIRRNIYELSELKLVDLRRSKGSNRKKEYLEEDRLRVFKKFGNKVLRKNPGLDIYLKLWRNEDIVSLIRETPASLSLQQIRVLIVWGCSKLEEVDLSCFPELRFLSIFVCKEVRLVRGWEAVTKLGRLEIGACGSFVDFPPLQYLPSLRECWVDSISAGMFSVPNDFRQCVRLRRLEISYTETSAWNKMDLSMLRFLEVLTLYSCKALTSIQGLSGLHSLTTLDVSWCKGLKRVPDLGCLKALTRLDMRYSGIEEIPGVQELYSLTSLDLFECRSLKELPFLGHLKALAKLNVWRTNVEEIPGVEYLVNLETLDCNFSKLKWLPDLHHLPHLQMERVQVTPLHVVESLPFALRKSIVYLGSSNAKKMVFLTEISDISDTERIDSDDDYC